MRLFFVWFTALCLALVISSAFAGTNFIFVSTTADWTPASKSGLVVWWDASQLTGLSDTDPITSITDYSGNARHATSSGTNRALYKTSVQNGKPGILFDGSNDYYTFGTENLYSNSSPISVVFVTDVDPQGSEPWYQAMLLLKSATTDRNFMLIQIKGDAARKNLMFGFSSVTGQALTYPLGHDTLFTTAGWFLINGTGAQTAGSGTNSTSDWEFKANGGSAETLTQVGAASLNSGNVNQLGSWTGAPALTLKGHIFEVMIWNSVVSSGELASLDAYIQSKWNL